jgi:hypothetical protein
MDTESAGFVQGGILDSGKKFNTPFFLIFREGYFDDFFGEEHKMLLFSSGISSQKKCLKTHPFPGIEKRACGTDALWVVGAFPAYRPLGLLWYRSTVLPGGGGGGGGISQSLPLEGVDAHQDL